MSLIKKSVSLLTLLTLLVLTSCVPKHVKLEPVKCENKPSCAWINEYRDQVEPFPATLVRAMLRCVKSQQLWYEACIKAQEDLIRDPY